MVDFQVEMEVGNSNDADIIKSFFEDDINIDTEFDILIDDIGLDSAMERKTHQCSICGKQYATRGGMKRHETMKHSAKTYQKSNTEFDFEKSLN